LIDFSATNPSGGLSTSTSPVSSEQRTQIIEPAGVEPDNVMPPHRWLTDQQIADVLSYIRQSWGNKADAVKSEEVTKTRASVVQ